MKSINKNLSTLLLSSLMVAVSLNGCEREHGSHAESGTTGHESAAEVEIEKGPNNGRMLRQDDFAMELSLFETGVPPEFRVYTSKAGQALNPEDVKVNIQLTRLGGKVDNINFTPYGKALRGNMEIYEPHSFAVTITAEYEGNTYTWQYDNFEGRTQIETEVAKALGIKTEIAGTKVLKETVKVYGQLNVNSERMRAISARFEGVIKDVKVSVGDKVAKGQKLAVVESNESLEHYSISSPIDGVITVRAVNPGEQTAGRQLFTVVDNSSVWADLSVFPSDRSRIKVGTNVSLTIGESDKKYIGKVSHMDPIAQANQAVNVRVVLDNTSGELVPGSFITAQIEVAEHSVPLAVKRTGLQAFRDFTVVYAQIGDQYEVRMLELGLESGDWVEVLGGLEPGTRYVSDNSYVIKAYIEKSGASHDH